MAAPERRERRRGERVLRDDRVGAAGARRRLERVCAVDRDEHDHDRRKQLTDPPRRLHAAHAGHPHVHQDEVGQQQRGQRDSVFSGGGLACAIEHRRRVLDDRADDPPEGIVVVDREHPAVLEACCGLRNGADGRRRAHAPVGLRAPLELVRVRDVGAVREVEQGHGDATALNAVVRQVQLREDGVDVLLDGPLGEEHRVGDRGVALALGHEADHLELPRREVGQRRALRANARGDEALHDLGVDGRASCRDLADRRGELAGIGDPVLQQVRAPGRTALEEAQRVLGLGVLAEHDDAESAGESRAPRSRIGCPRPIRAAACGCR